MSALAGPFVALVIPGSSESMCRPQAGTPPATRDSLCAPLPLGDLCDL